MSNWRRIPTEILRSDKAKRIAALLIMAFVLLATSRSLLSAATLNLASVHLVRGASFVVEPRFPFVFAPAGRMELDQAAALAQRGLQRGSPSPRLSCVLLRAYTISMAWPQARELVDIGACADVTIGGFKALAPVVDGLRALDQGDLGSARLKFHQAMTASSGLLSPSLAPWIGASPIGEKPSLAQDRPRFLVGRKVDYAWQPMPEPVSGAWSLVGYDLDESALETGQVVGISLFWQQDQPDVPVPATLKKAGAFWRQDTAVVNMIPDAGFEWASEGAKTWKLPDSGDVIAMERNGSQTHGLRILPDPAGGAATASTPVLALGDNCLYLMGGWVASDGAAPVFNIVWDGLPNDANDPPFTSLMEGVRDLEWTHVSQLVRAKPGGRGVAVYASNLAARWPQAAHPPGSMLADNVFLIPISGPDSPPCALQSGAQVRP